MKMEIKHRNCAVCRSNESITIYKQPIGSIVGIGNIEYVHKIDRCNVCGFIFANSILQDNEILKYYEKMSNYENPEHSGLHSEMRKQSIEKQINFILGHLPKNFKGSALDVGCSVPYGLSVLKIKGWKVLGLDPSDSCIKIAKDLWSIDVKKGFFNIENFEDEKPFDLIILSHVLEHLIYPSEILSQLKEILSEDGVIYIEVPNLLEHNNLTGYFTFEHVNYFTPLSLENIVKNNGFEIRKIQLIKNDESELSYSSVGVLIQKSQSVDSVINFDNSSIAAVEEYKAQIGNRIKKINSVLNLIDKTIKKGRLALWGGGIHTSQLLSETNLREMDIFCIYDNDPKKNGECILSIPIYTFPNDINMVLKNVDAILISSQASENEIYNQISKFEQSGLKIFRLYQMAE
jgi:2-polyprenyl-3-methyl-5-hydroxy-6-metoxy-1,4-benzoquinol methylase